MENLLNQNQFKAEVNLSEFPILGLVMFRAIEVNSNLLPELCSSFYPDLAVEFSQLLEVIQSEIGFRKGKKPFSS